MSKIESIIDPEAFKDLDKITAKLKEIEERIKAINDEVPKLIRNLMRCETIAELNLAIAPVGSAIQSCADVQKIIAFAIKGIGGDEQDALPIIPEGEPTKPRPATNKEIVAELQGITGNILNDYKAKGKS